MERPRLGARFEIRGTLGTGGAGTVYRAYDGQLQREVALKHLRQASGRDLYRFKREFRALADIVHPNLVTLHELHEAEGDWYFTMELVEGVSFIDWVRPSRTMSGPTRTRQDIVASPVHEVRLRGALVQLVDALIALHKAGKLHRDLKPSNVLVTQQGRLALLDFGLVSSVAELNPEKLAVGTPVYMSPEQASDQTLTEASDWYSVGAMLYEALVGRRPFEGESEQVMTRKQSELPPSPLGVSPGLPTDLAQLAMQLLAPSPAARPDGLAILASLGAAPSPRTRAMARSSMPATFVGRKKELDELRRAQADSRRRGQTVTIKGKSGMGKSALARTFLRSLGETVFVLEGRCFEREQVPFKMLDGVVDMLTAVLLALPPADVDALAPKDLGALVRLFPVMKRIKRFADVAPAPGDPAELRRRGFAALRHVLARLAKLRPVVIFVDDAHWGDADSIAFFADLIHNPESSVLIVLAHRPEDYLGVMAKLKQPPGTVRRGELREVEISNLPEHESHALVSQLVPEPAQAEIVMKAAGGNPLLLTEMARAPQLAPTAKVEDLVQARVARVSFEAQAMLAVSSIAARPLPIEVAARAAGLVGGHDEARQLAAERLATIRRIGDATVLAPAHDHVRTAVVASLDVESKAQWHEALAKAFEEAGELDPQAVVEHWLAAGHPANAAHHAVAAAAKAEDALAFRRAAELYKIALNYGPWDVMGQRDLLRKQATALACAGQLDEAASVYGHAAQLFFDEEAVDCERLRIEALLRRGRLDEALPAAETLLAAIGVRSPFGASRTRLAAQWMQQKLRGVDFVERDATQCKPSDLRRIDVLYSIVSGLAFADPGLGRALQAELMRTAFECGEPMRVCLALAQELCYSAAAGSRNAMAVSALGTRLQQLADKLGDPQLLGIAKLAIGIAAYMSGSFVEARKRLEAGLEVMRAHAASARWELDIGEQYWLSSLYYVGEWREMIRQVQLLVRDAIERNDLVAQLGVRTGRCNLAWLIAGRPDEASSQLEAAIHALAPGFQLPHVLAVQAACNIEIYRGEIAAATQRLDQAWPDIERIGVLRMQQLRCELQYLRIRLVLRDRGKPAEERARFVKQAAEELMKEGAPWAVGIGLCARAAALHLRGDRAGAIASLAAAEEQLTTSGMTGWMHIARMRRATLEGGPTGVARAAAARDFLSDLGAADPDRIAGLLIPWPTLG
ncbi:MAG: protein kinase [Deltaproteobacteria bacterium]|nr:protein kinase [Deltaproteobacteria bacterium]